MSAPRLGPRFFPNQLAGRLDHETAARHHSNPRTLPGDCRATAATGPRRPTAHGLTESRSSVVRRVHASPGVHPIPEPDSGLRRMPPAIAENGHAKTD